MFSIDGKLFRTLSKIGDLFILNVLWLVGCIPIVTIGVSTASMYHCCIKCVRRDRSQVGKEFWKAYKMNFKQGVLGTLICAVLIYLVLVLYSFASTLIAAGASSFRDTVFVLGMMVFTIIVASFCSIFFPVLSRFSMSFAQLLKLTFFMSFRYFIRGAAAGIITFVLFYAVLGNYMMVLFIPAPVSLLFTFFFEPMLLKHTPREMVEGQDDWYFEGQDKRTEKKKTEGHRQSLIQRLGKKK